MGSQSYHARSWNQALLRRYLSKVDQEGIPPPIAIAHPRISQEHFLLLQKDAAFLTRSMPACCVCYLRMVEFGAPALHGGDRAPYIARTLQPKPQSSTGRSQSSVYDAILSKSASTPTLGGGVAASTKTNIDQEVIYDFLCALSLKSKGNRISKNQLVAATKELGLNVASEEVDSLFMGAQTDESGTVDIRDVMALLQNSGKRMRRRRTISQAKVDALQQQPLFFAVTHFHLLPPSPHTPIFLLHDTTTMFCRQVEWLLEKDYATHAVNGAGIGTSPASRSVMPAMSG